MIIKQVDKKPGNTGSFKGLADYILDTKNNKEKVQWHDINNCPFDDTDINIKYIEDIQDLNQRVTGDKTLHLIISFQEDEIIPPKDILHNIEKEFVRSIGLEEHQRLSVMHTNTDNTHIHVAVNLIHPETLQMNTLYQSKKKLQTKATELEHRYNLKKTTIPQTTY